MTLAGGIVTVRGIRMGIAFVDPAMLRAGAGGALLVRLNPWFPGLPIMLLSADAGAPMAYASFDTRALLPHLDLAGMIVHDIDLDLPPPDIRQPPF